MRGFVVITDSEVLPAFEAAFLESGDHGFTIVPKVVGRGRTGLKMGSRVHPGGSSLLFTVVPDVEAEPMARFLRDARDRAGAAEQTKIFSLRLEQED
jgi:hypothetical protein